MLDRQLLFELIFLSKTMNKERQSELANQAIRQHFRILDQCSAVA